MSAGLIAVIVVVATLAYITIGSFVYEIACRVAPPEHHDDIVQWLAGSFWPLALPAWLAVRAFQAALWLGMRLGSKRAPRVKLPKAQVRR